MTTGDDVLCADFYTQWAAESVRMADIYQRSLLNIAATAAPDGSFGLFFSRDPSLIQPCMVLMNKFAGKTSPSGLYELVSARFWARNANEGPLNRRAWVLQEQFLSRRILHCGDVQLLWECHEMVIVFYSPPSPILEYLFLIQSVLELMSSQSRLLVNSHQKVFPMNISMHRSVLSSSGRTFGPI